MVRLVWTLFGLASLLQGCTHTVEVKPDDKPIKVDVNLKIDQKIKVKVQKDLNKVKKEKPEIFA
jgi:hypothetical protein